MMQNVFEVAYVLNEIQQYGTDRQARVQLHTLLLCTWAEGASGTH
jgi:hypothetical protein